MCGVKAVHRVRGEKLASASKELFEVGELEAGPLKPGYVRRLNILVARRWVDMGTNVPDTLADAIKAKGVLTKHAELVVFGNWLIDDSPGAKPRPGEQANPKKILKCVAAILSKIHAAERKNPHAQPARAILSKIHAAERKNPHAQPARGRESRTREITKKDVADQWKHLFGEKITASNFDAPLRSARRILSDYLGHLKSGSAVYAGKKVKKSPEIKRALDAINGLLPASQTGRPEIFTEDAPRPATLVPFEIALEYQSDTHAEEHRRLPSGTTLNPRLRYVPHKTAPTSLSGKVRADREGKITLVPDVDIRKDYEVKALIDRLAILISTTAKIDDKELKRQIEKKTGSSTFVRDLTKKKNEVCWGAPLPVPDLNKSTGYHFAIMIQEPTPGVLTAILKAIGDGPGFIDPVLLHLIEVSVDFYPKKPCTPEEAVLRRERMVGLLQRHHWSRPSRILEPGSATPRYADARQIHDDPEKLPKRKPKTRYMFAHVAVPGKKTKHTSDSMIAEEGIRDRVLTTNVGYTIFLNSTVSKGDKFKPHLISIQNKISDKRDPIKRTFVTLPDEERRARMEVTISGTETLKKHGLHTIDDLSSISFRKITRDYLRCRLPIIEPVQHIFEDAQTQMRNRGVYGVNLRLRALSEERRLAAKRAGKKLPRKTKDEEMGLADWKEMNDEVGHALDGLRRRWSRFTIK